MPITPFPPAPRRADPANFADEADAYLSHLESPFVGEANALEANVNAKEAAATASATAAAASELAAANTANVAAWVSGTTYAVGVNRYDTTDFLTYRRKTAGAGTTRPGLDPTNWQLLTGLGNVVLNGGPLSGLRNLIINGNFAINQRGYVSGSAVPAANTYTLDRWRVVTSGQSATFTTTGNGRTVTAPSGGIEQVIEGASIAGGSYVINWTGTATCTVNGIARAKGATFTLTAGSNATVRFSSGTVSVVQLEPGTVATVFEERPIGLELMLCQRYYQTGTFVNGVGSQGGSDYFANYSAKVSMRVAPTIIVSPIPEVRANGTALTVLSAIGDNSTANDFGFAFTVATTPTSSVRLLGGGFSASAEL